MKICFFDFIINFGGAPQGTLYLLKRLKDEGLDAYVVDAYGSCDQYIERASEYSLPVTVLQPYVKKSFIGFKGQPIKRLIAILFQLKAFFILFLNLLFNFSRLRPNIVLVNNEKSLLFVLVTKIFLNFKVVLYYRGEAIPQQLNKRFLWLLDRRCDHIIAHSEKAVTNLINAGIRKHKITYVPNCIELEKFELSVLSEDLPPKPEIRIILAAARPVKEKGHHVAIEALNLLIKNNIDADLIIPGKIPTGVDDSFFNHLNALIEKYSLYSRVHFIGWRENLLGDICQSDFVILPSHTEGFPRVVIEAMVQGVAVCATSVGGIPEAILHKQTGMLFEVDNAHQLADCLLELIHNKALHKSIKDQGVKVARSKFHPDKNTKAVLSVLNKLGE